MAKRIYLRRHRDTIRKNPHIVHHRDRRYFRNEIHPMVGVVEMIIQIGHPKRPVISALHVLPPETTASMARVIR